MKSQLQEKRAIMNTITSNSFHKEIHIYSEVETGFNTSSLKPCDN